MADQTAGRPRPLAVIILDGWGISFVNEGNAILAADTPVLDAYAAYYPVASIDAAGAEVGLPWGEMGNSETGHRNIGAGQVQYQALPAIDTTIANGSFFENPVLAGAIEHAKKYNSNLHLMGLVSPGGIHAHMNHLFALLQMCTKHNFQDRVYIHMFTDGRDTAPQAALAYLQSLEEAIGKYGVGRIASVTGRFYAMDRNENWERTESTYNLLVGGKRKYGAPSARQAIEQAYQQEILDEMIPPTAVTRGGGPVAVIGNNDAVIFFNFRPDRARQVTQAFVQPSKVGFETQPLENVYFATMTRYDRNIPSIAAFVEEPPDYPLARVLSDAGLTQLHIAETEKYAHVTYYLNVGHEDPFPGEEHKLIHSSGVESFADEPEMQAEKIASAVIESTEAGAYDVYFINFANPDMVGHTGDFEAAVRACSFVDTQIGRIGEAVLAKGGALLITADHGNAEEMTNPATGDREKDHTSNPVPIYYVNSRLARSTPKAAEEVAEIMSSPIGVLADVAPTILDILEMEKSVDMTGVSLLPSLR